MHNHIHDYKLIKSSLQSLGCPANGGRRGAIEDNKRSLESNIAEDVDADARAGLQAAEAGRAARRDRAVVHVGAGDGDSGRADAEGEAGQRAAAWEDVTTVGVAVGRAADLGVVGSDDGGGKVEQGGTGIGDSGDARRGEGG